MEFQEICALVANLSIPQLQELISYATRQIEKREVADAQALREQFEQIARERGIDLSAVFGVEIPQQAAARGRKPGSTHALAGTKVPAKYRHPQNAELEWTGRGRAPKWVEEWKAQGGSVDDLLIG